MRLRDLRPLGLVALIGVVVALANTVAGLDTGLMLLAPALVLLLPLLAGRYLGEERLATLARRFAAPSRRRAVVRQAPLARSHARVLRGGRLLAASLAERGPPATVLA